MTTQNLHKLICYRESLSSQYKDLKKKHKRGQRRTYKALRDVTTRLLREEMRA